jgi:hypothetical protein
MNSTHSTQRQGGARPYNKLTTNGEKFGFKRALLPSTWVYLNQIIKLPYKGNGAWVTAVCPFHDDTSPSLRINLEKGAFACLACGAKGGDVLAFHMQLHNMGFIAAAKAIGAWSNQ